MPVWLRGCWYSGCVWGRHGLANAWYMPACSVDIAPYSSSRARLGKRVAVVSTSGGIMWSEYAVANAMQALPLPDEASFEQGCSCFVNPLTAISFVEYAQAGKHTGMLLSAAASSLCKMTIKLCVREANIRVIGTVRKENQVQELLDLGATAVVVTSKEGWQAELKELCKQHNVTIAFDAVAGEMTGHVGELSLCTLPPPCCH